MQNFLEVGEWSVPSWMFRLAPTPPDGQVPRQDLRGLLPALQRSSHLHHVQVRHLHGDQYCCNAFLYAQSSVTKVLEIWISFVKYLEKGSVKRLLFLICLQKGDFIFFLQIRNVLKILQIRMLQHQFSVWVYGRHHGQ